MGGQEELQAHDEDGQDGKRHELQTVVHQLGMGGTGSHTVSHHNQQQGEEEITKKIGKVMWSPIFEANGALTKLNRCGS